MTDKTINVSVALNDNNGESTGYAEVFDFGNDLLHLDCNSTPVGFRRINQTQVKVSRRVFEITSYTTWYGSMRYDGMQMTLNEAQRLAEYLRSLDKFDADMCHPVIGDAWYENQPINFDVPEPEPEIVVQLSIRPRGEE